MTRIRENLACTKTVGEIQISLSVNRPSENGTYQERTDKPVARKPRFGSDRFLWPVVREIVKTCIENGQNLIVEGCYIPFGWEKDFADDYLCDIKYMCLIFSKEYIKQHFADIVKNESVIEKRLSTDIVADEMIKSNRYNLEQCKLRGYDYILIDDVYQITTDIK